MTYVACPNWLFCTRSGCPHRHRHEYYGTKRDGTGCHNYCGCEEDVCTRVRSAFWNGMNPIGHGDAPECQMCLRKGSKGCVKVDDNNEDLPEVDVVFNGII